MYTHHKYYLIHSYESSFDDILPKLKDQNLVKHIGLRV